MQKWDYLTVMQGRGWETRKDRSIPYSTDWITTIYEKGKEKEWNGKITDLLDKLGDDGWELASAFVQSNTQGGANVTSGTIKPVPFTNGSEGSIGGVTTDFAGWTDQRSWVFKRPRQ